jgi:hypothetical protein
MKLCGCRNCATPLRSHCSQAAAGEAGDGIGVAFKHDDLVTVAREQQRRAQAADPAANHSHAHRTI